MLSSLPPLRSTMYLVRGGRINVAGITTRNLDYLCDAVAEALTSTLAS